MYSPALSLGRFVAQPMLLASVTATKTAATLRLIRFIPGPSKEQGSSNSCIVPDFMAMRSHFAIGHRRHAHPRLGCLCWHAFRVRIEKLAPDDWRLLGDTQSAHWKITSVVKEPNKKGRV
jgi:hypothetical protein